MRRGGEPVQEILKRLGATYWIPASQKDPSGDFATCPNPNPENDTAFNESYALAKEVKPDLVMATDPDSDRIAVAIPQGDGFRKFSGNRNGLHALRLYPLLPPEGRQAPQGACGREEHRLHAPGRPVAAAYGVKIRTVLTGFKYIGGVILELEQAGHPEDFVLGFEESCAYLKATTPGIRTPWSRLC